MAVATYACKDKREYVYSRSQLEQAAKFGRWGQMGRGKGEDLPNHDNIGSYPIMFSLGPLQVRLL